jgi:hypothetical protein
LPKPPAQIIRFQPKAATLLKTPIYFENGADTLTNVGIL